MVITIPAADLPAVAVNGWDLTTTSGLIKLSTATQSATLVFFSNEFKLYAVGD